MAVVPAAPFNRLPASFAHIFAGGYHRVTDYKWAEVLAADTFETFEEAGVADECDGGAVSRLHPRTRR